MNFSSGWFQDIITKEKWESFDLPWFNPNLKEVESIVKREGSFVRVSMKIVGGMNAHPITEVEKGEEKMFGRIVANQYRYLESSFRMQESDK
ncbi:hypothetical protein SUGI_0553710 [Cryptomeria japonica]|nr:hypothetical protein SUGI_0553710 [Cryptomeria japonica]